MRHRIFQHGSLWAGFFAVLLALHLPYLRLPWHWDELGQFVPAALDLYRDGAWITHTALPNIHPPGLMAILAAVWSFTGYGIALTRTVMLALAAWGVYLSYLLAKRLSHGMGRMPAVMAVAFLFAAPMFYTQSMMVLLDMPAMVFTLLAMLLFYDQRYALCAAACTVLVLVKETAITTPMVFGASLLFGWLQPRRIRGALYFFVPAFALGAWLIVLRQTTGSWFGNPEFASYNVQESLTPLHVIYAVLRRAYTLFFADGHWIGAIALVAGWRLLHTSQWKLAWAVAIAQIIPVTVFGGAVLDRYLLPVLPIFYAAFAVAASVYPPRVRMASHAALLAMLIVGWFVNSPIPLPLENNLSMVDFVQLQQQAARYVESNFGDRRIITTWPLSIALRRPDDGYVQRRLNVRAPASQHVEDIRAVAPGPNDVIVLYTVGHPPLGLLANIPYLSELTAPYVDLHPIAEAVEMRSLGFESRARWARGAHWIEVYTPTAPGTPPEPFRR